MRGLGGAAFGASRTVREIVGDTAGQLGQLNRLGRVSAGTRISFGLLMDEQAERAPDDVVLLFEDRAHTQKAVKDRVDNVVRGLLEIGVHQGEHVGVLMQTRPSALTVVAALNRLGAVAVLMRPDGDPAREAELGKAARIIADPQNAEAAQAATGVQVYVLGGGGKDRRLAPGLVDMERIDPDLVHVPAWYRPNPGRAGDLAFILFTGTGERTLANRITNRRWALSAFGTASSAALTSSDTVYSATPVYHPSALLMSVGGVVAGGARLAVASEFEPSVFWEEVRRYGATVVSYTWAMLDEIAEAPPNPAEQHHPVRLFMGSGMPRGLWRRVQHRFAPARVLEFYASTEGDAVLVNLSGRKEGSKGRPLPGSADVRIAAYDTAARRLIEGRDGFAVSCAKHEAGMLLARVRLDAIASYGDGVLRGVFEAGDAWLETGDLFRRDVDGDFWLDRPRADPDPDRPRGRAHGADPGRARRRRGGRARGRLRRPDGGRLGPDPLRRGDAPRRARAGDGRRRARPGRPRRRRDPPGDQGRRRDPADHLVPADERTAPRGGPAGPHPAGHVLVLGSEEGRLPGAQQGGGGSPAFGPRLTS